MLTSEELRKQAIMKAAITQANVTSSNGIGGPFGAAIVKDGEIICVSNNRVLKDNDPTAHAEITAIRAACKKLGTYDLSGCELYATSQPCPMCLSAIIWANIKKVYYCNDYADTEAIGFRDDFIYQYLRMADPSESDLVTFERIELPEGKELYRKYVENSSVIY